MFSSATSKVHLKKRYALQNSIPLPSHWNMPAHSQWHKKTQQTSDLIFTNNSFKTEQKSLNIISWSREKLPNINQYKKYYHIKQRLRFHISIYILIANYKRTNVSTWISNNFTWQKKIDNKSRRKVQNTTYLSLLFHLLHWKHVKQKKYQQPNQFARSKIWVRNVLCCYLEASSFFTQPYINHAICYISHSALQYAQIWAHFYLQPLQLRNRKQKKYHQPQLDSK